MFWMRQKTSNLSLLLKHDGVDEIDDEDLMDVLRHIDALQQRVLQLLLKTTGIV